MLDGYPLMSESRELVQLMSSSPARVELRPTSQVSGEKESDQAHIVQSLLVLDLGVDDT